MLQATAIYEQLRDDVSLRDRASSERLNKRRLDGCSDNSSTVIEAALARPKTEVLVARRDHSWIVISILLTKQKQAVEFRKMFDVVAVRPSVRGFSVIGRAS